DLFFCQRARAKSTPLYRPPRCAPGDTGAQRASKAPDIRVNIFRIVAKRRCAPGRKDKLICRSVAQRRMNAPLILTYFEILIDSYFSRNYKLRHESLTMAPASIAFIV